MDTAFKTCPKCKQIFPRTAEFFYHDSYREGDLTLYCKTCVNARSRAYRQAHKEELLARAHARVAARKEEMAAIHRAYRAAHPKQAAVPRPGYAEYDRYGRLAGPGNVKGGSG